MPHVVGEHIDRLSMIGMRPKGMSREAPGLLYEIARAEAQEALTMKAARLLADTVEPGDTVLIATGAGAPPWMPYGETDGPLGAVALGRALPSLFRLHLSSLVSSVIWGRLKQPSARPAC